MKKTVLLVLVALLGFGAYLVGGAITVNVDEVVLGIVGTILEIGGLAVAFVAFVAAIVVGFRRAWKWSRS